MSPQHILTTMMMRIVVDKSTDIRLVFLQQYQRLRKWLFFQAPVVRKPISANPRLNRPNPRNKFVLRLNSVPRSSISTI